MRTKSEFVFEPYDRKNIFETIDKLDISQREKLIVTKFDNRTISASNVSDKYELFDFKPFTKSILGEIENYFMPDKYTLKITKGQQELRLIGEEVMINGELYNKMFNILNSTDRSRSLQLNVGLIRYICTNGMVVAYGNEYAGFKGKHFTSTLPDKVDTFINSLPNFEMNINRQCEIIESLSNKFVSFRDIVNNLGVDRDGVLDYNKLRNVQRYVNKLMFSTTDRLEKISDEQIELLNNVNLIMDKKFNNIDIEFPASQAVNCWTEIFRASDSSIIKRETNRILQLI